MWLVATVVDSAFLKNQQQANNYTIYFQTLAYVCSKENKEGKVGVVSERGTHFIFMIILEFPF